MGAKHLIFQYSNAQSMWQNLAPKGIHGKDLGSYSLGAHKPVSRIL